MLHLRTSILTLLKKIPNSEAKTNIFSGSPCQSQTLKLAPQIWLAGTRLEVREYPHNLREAVEYCQNISEVLSNFCLELAMLFLLLLLSGFIPTLILVASTYVRDGACMWSLICSMNSSVGEKFTVARHGPSYLQRIHSHQYIIRKHLFQTRRCIHL